MRCNRVFEVIHQLLRECIKPTQQMILSLIKVRIPSGTDPLPATSQSVQVELAHINTSHPDFIGGKKVRDRGSLEMMTVSGLTLSITCVGSP